MKNIIALSMVMSAALVGVANAQNERSSMPAPMGYEEKMKDGEHPVMAEKIKERKNKHFEEMDTNNDGAISQEEYVDFAAKRASERFSKMDKDGDGKITKEEFEANRPNFGKGKPFYGKKPDDAKGPMVGKPMIKK